MKNIVVKFYVSTIDLGNMGNLRLFRGLFFFWGGEVWCCFSTVVVVFPQSCSYTQLIQHIDGINELGLSTCKMRSKMQDNALSGTEFFLKDTIQKIA